MALENITAESFTEALCTYNKFGFSFDCGDHYGRVEVEGHPFFSTEANEEAGVLRISTPLLRLDVYWLTMEDVNRSYIEEQITAYLSGRGKDHTLYMGDYIESECMGHTVLGGRFVTEGEDGILLNNIGAWYCDNSGRVFMVNYAADWEDPVFITDGINVLPEWPDSRFDPSCNAYKEVMSTFQCH